MQQRRHRDAVVGRMVRFIQRYGYERFDQAFGERRPRQRQRRRVVPVAVQQPLFDDDNNFIPPPIEDDFQGGELFEIEPFVFNYEEWYVTYRAELDIQRRRNSHNTAIENAMNYLRGSVQIENDPVANVNSVLEHNFFITAKFVDLINVCMLNEEHYFAGNGIQVRIVLQYDGTTFNGSFVDLRNAAGNTETNIDQPIQVYDRWGTYISRVADVIRQKDDYNMDFWNNQSDRFLLQVEFFYIRRRLFPYLDPLQRAANRRRRLEVLQGRGAGARRGPRVRIPPQFVGHQRHFFYDKDVAKAKAVDLFGVRSTYNVVPNTDEMLCLPMAIINCQLRIIKFSPVNGEMKATDISETASTASFIPNGIQIAYRRAEMPSVSEDQEGSFFNDECITIGNPCFISPIYWEEWIAAAKILMRCVNERVGFEVDYNEIEEGCQAIATALGVYIHVFYDEQSARRYVFKPDFNGRLTLDVHLYLHVADHHVSSIVNIRKYLHPQCTRLLGVCDYCQNMQYNTTSTKTTLKHISKCRNSQNSVKPYIQDFRRSLGTTTYTKYYNRRDRSNSYNQIFCSCCHTEVQVEDTIINHDCYINWETAAKCDPLENEKIFAYDIESTQEVDEFGKHSHQCILVVLSNVYNEDMKWKFSNIEDFVDFLYEPDNIFMHGATIFAHNGGAYDHLFVMRVLDKTGRVYDKVERPSSHHKYLEIRMMLPSCKQTSDKRYRRDGDDFIILKDFFTLCPGSLDGIAKSFNLPTCKGVFPHYFLNSGNLGYNGRIPPLDSVEDYYGLRDKKSQSDIDKLRDWHIGQCAIYCTCSDDCMCEKRRWNAMKVITEYCEKDVEVLCACLRTFRSKLMTIPVTECCAGYMSSPIDPLAKSTLAQCALSILSSGWNNASPMNRQMMYVPPQIMRDRPWQMQMYCEQQCIDGKPWLYYGNTGKDPYIQSKNLFADAYDTSSGTFYFYFDDVSETESALEIFSSVLAGCGCSYDIVTESHILATSRLTGDKDDLKIVYEAYNERDAFFGGNTNVFKAYVNVEKCNEHRDIMDQPLMEICKEDVTSLYPFVCSFRALPIGKPEFISFQRVERHRLDPTGTVDDRYFGYVKCKVSPDPKEYIGLLPHKDVSGRLMFTLEQKVGWWFTEELYFAMQHNYIVDEVYQVVHYDENNRSDTFMRGYMEYWLREKLECEGWDKLSNREGDLTDEEKEAVCEEVYIANGRIAKPRKECVRFDPAGRAIAKLFLNSLWGKLGQINDASHSCDVTGMPELTYLLNESKLDVNKFTFRCCGEWTMKLTYQKTVGMMKPNPRINPAVASAVTAWARSYLTSRMYLVGPENLIYCDTDSVTYLRQVNTVRQPTGGSLGQWKDEIDPGKKLVLFCGAAPKFYTCIYMNEDGTYYQETKIKGVCQTVTNKERLTKKAFMSMILDYVYEGDENTIELDNMVIHSNINDGRYDYGQLFTTRNTKKARAVLRKRELDASNLPTFEDIGDDDLFERFYDSVDVVNLNPIGFETTSEDVSDDGLDLYEYINDITF